MSTESIEYYIETIQNATLGEDVRNAIVGALRKCYEDGRSGSTDLEVRERVSTLEAKLGDADISALGPTLTDAVLEANENQYYKIGDTVSIDNYDWLPGFFVEVGGGQVVFTVPLTKLAPLEVPSNRATSDAGLPFITGDFMYLDKLRAVGAGGWQEVLIANNVSIDKCELNRDRSSIRVTLNCPLIQDKNKACLISVGIRFRFTDGTAS